MSKQIIVGYVWHDEQCFLVSTINRASSAIGAYEYEYAETMAWKYDFEKRVRGEWVYQGESSKDSFVTHNKVCKSLFDTGLPKAADLDDLALPAP